MPLVFLNPALLGATAAVAVPVAIHLFYRRKTRTDVLPTLKFLRRGLAASRRRLRFRHLLVMLLRAAAVLLVVLALSRPAYRGALFFRQGSAPVDAVIVIDNSPSMAYSLAGRKRLDVARHAASRLARSLPPGSRMALVVTGVGHRGESLDRAFTFSSPIFCSGVSRLEISAYGGSCTEGLRRAWTIARDQVDEGAAAGVEVYVFSDLAANAWRGLLSLEAPPDVATFVIDVSAEGHENFRILNVKARLRGSVEPYVEVEAELAGSQLGASRLLEVNLAGTKRAEKVIELAPNARVKVRFDIPVVAPQGRAISGFVRLSDTDPINADNTFYLTIPPRSAIRALIVAAQDSWEAAFFLANALEPAGLEGAAHVSVERVNIGDLSLERLGEIDLLLVAGSAGMSRREWEVVERFCRRGGGVLLFLSPGVHDVALASFVAKSTGLSISRGAGSREREGGALTVVSFDHPVFKAFADGANGDITASRFYRWTRLLFVNGAAASAVELARFERREPALVAAKVGEGRLVIAAFVPERASTDIMLRASFVPLVNELAAWVAGVPTDTYFSAPQYTVGEPVRLPGGARALVKTPTSDEPVELASAGAGSMAFTGYFPGNYSAEVFSDTTKSAAAFSYNLDPAEGGAARVASAEIEEAVNGCVVTRSLADERVRQARGATRGAREVFDLVLVLAIGILAVEAFVANRFYREGS